MDHNIRPKWYPHYIHMLCVFAFFVIYAFIVDTPSNIWDGLGKIIVSRSLLITDYVEVGGLGATLMNSALVGTFAVVLMNRSGVKPNGAIIMGLWLTAGFGFFGKNLFNTLPLSIGVWLYSRFQKEPFINYSLAALMVATLSPAVSEISFLGIFSRPAGIFFGILLGMLIGFIFPMISAFVVRVHDGYTLYSMGFAGGIIAMFFVAALGSVGITIETKLLWSTGNNLKVSIFLYILSASLIVAGLVLGRGRNIREDLSKMSKLSGRLVSDFYVLFGESVYINMGVLGILATTVMLLMGADLNGPTMGGVFAIIGFGCFGKHLRNAVPVLFGAILSTIVNTWNPTDPSNTLAILFSTSLAPIAGQFGARWGVLAGFLHVNIVIHAAYLSNGLNLYNNGFASGFVAMFLVPIITSLRSAKE